MVDTPKQMTYAVPQDAEYLAAVGAVAITHAQLDHALRMMIKTLSEVSIQEAMKATEYDGSKYLREQVRKLGRKRFGVSQAYIKLKAVLANCEKVTRRRNDLLHSIFGKFTNDDEIRVQTKELGWSEPPTIGELVSLELEIRILANSMHYERLEGFISDALR